MILKKNKLAICITQALLTGAFALGGLAADANAEGTDTDNGTPVTSDQPVQDEASIAKVIITAQNRSQQLQDVPISLQVINNEQITKLGANNMADLNGYIPGLVVDNQQPTQPNYTIRGVGSGDSFVGTDAPVGIYVDGVYTGKTGGALMNFNDIERVEVLKGPQGTLFGRNSAAGAISVVTKEPSNEFENDYNARFGEYGDKYLDVLLNIPLSETMSARFSFVDHRSNGWLTDAATGESLNDQGDWGTRATLRWNAPEHTKVILSWEHENLNQEARPDIGLLPLSLQVPTPPFPANPATYINPITAPAYNGLGNNVEKRLFNGVTLRIEHPMEWATFDSTTAYRHFNSTNIVNNTGTNLANSYIDTGNLENNTTWQQEFRLSGKNDTVDWLAGASLYHESATQQSQILTNTDTLDTLFTSAQVPGAPGQTVGPIYTQLNQGSAGLGLYGVPGFPVPVFGNSWQENMDNAMTSKSYAFYGDAIWHLTSKLNLTTGVRFTHDAKDFSWYNPPRIAPGVDGLMNNLIPALQGANLISPTQAGQLLYLLGTNIEYNAQGATNSPYAASNSWTDTSPRLVLDYKFTPDILVFGSVTKGYQSGGFNGQYVGATFSPETIRSYELGLKSYFPEQHLRVNASVFFYKFDNFQSLSLINNNQAIPQYQVTTSNQTAQGVDLDAQWKLSRNLRLYAVGEYIDQVYADNTQLNGVNLSNQPYQTPFYSAAGGLDYTQRDVWDGGSINYSLQEAYVGATRCNSASQGQGNCLVAPTFRLGTSTQHTDARIAWDASDHKWGAGLYVTNLLNKRYVTGVDNTTTTVLGTPAAQISAPRFVGVQLHYSM